MQHPFTVVSGFAAELKRRHVVKVALVYCTVGWLVTEVSSTVFPALLIPDIWVTLVTLLVILGLPVALVLTWAFDLTPEGVRRTPARSPEFAMVADPDHPAVLALPFVDRSPDGDHQYLGDGITEELINSLARVEGVRVVSRTSAFALRSAASDLREFGRAYGVSHVVEGSVRLTERRVRVTVQLIGVSDGYTVWAETLDRMADDIFGLQQEIARAVAGALRPALFAAPVPAGTVPAGVAPAGSASARDEPAGVVMRDGPATAASATRNFEAYTLYLKGRQKWNERSPASLRQALQHFTDAVQRDSDFAHAYAGIADCWCILVDHGIVAPAEGLPPAAAAATAALRLGPDTAEGHTSDALVRQMEWAWTQAEAGFRKALDLNPDYEPARHRLALLLAWRGRSDEARAEMLRAQRTDPLSPVIAASMGWVEYFAGNYGDAIDIERRVLDEYPGAPGARVPLALALVQAGDAEQAVNVLRAGAADESAPLQGLLAFALARAGRDAEAKQLVSTLEAAEVYVSPVSLAQAWLGLGDKTRALQLLETATAQRAPQLVRLNADPTFAPLRAEPGFLRIMERVG
jgi:TolB-like protein/tetratricopeptide (TPR) repeat protein